MAWCGVEWLGVASYTTWAVPLTLLCVFTSSPLLPCCQPNAVVVIIMQPGWCLRHWLFSSQAIAAGHSAVVVCHEGFGVSDSHTRFKWSEAGWAQVRGCSG